LQAFTAGLIEGHIATDIIITISGWAGPYRHGERTKAAIAERQRLGALRKSSALA
jgi:hypothetical protein